MRLMRLDLRGFTAFDNADFSFAPGINVLIGENGTGKAHVLRSLHALMKVAAPILTRDAQTETVDGALRATFMPDRLASLIRLGNDEATLRLTTDSGEVLCRLGAGDWPRYKSSA